jgi:hypothetical protein
MEIESPEDAAVAPRRMEVLSGGEDQPPTLWDGSLEQLGILDRALHRDVPSDASIASALATLDLVTIPSDAIKLLPEEYQAILQAVADRWRTVGKREVDPPR